MSLKAGDSFPEGVTFSYVPYKDETAAITSCGIPINYDATKGTSIFVPPLPRLPVTMTNGINEMLTSGCGCAIEWADKKVVLFAVPGAFTPGCSARHLPGYIENLSAIKAKGVDVVAVIAYNDAFVMSAWGKANGIKGDIVSLFVHHVDWTEPFHIILFIF